MIRVRSLHIYPVKSCRAIDLNRAEVVATGLRWDRRWMVVSSDGGFISQRGHPQLATVATAMRGDRLGLQAPGLPELEIPLGEPKAPRRSVKVWNNVTDAVSEGPAAAAWFSSLLGTPCELVRQPDDAIRPVDPRYAGTSDRVSFADGFPLLLISSGSLDELNRCLEVPVPADRFRANIVVEGCEPYAEDNWSEIEIGELELGIVKSCARCVVITTDQQTGSRTREPLRTLAEQRTVNGKVLFGQNLVHRGCGSLRVGDRVRVVESRRGL